MSNGVKPEIFVARMERNDACVSSVEKRLRQILIATCSIGTIGFGGLAVGAFVHHEWTCLLWAVSGVGAWAAIWAVTTLLVRKIPERLKPDERTVVTVDILKERVQRGHLPTPPVGKGTLSWLTDKGVYIGSNYISWQYFFYYYVSDNDGKNILRLYLSLPPPKSALIFKWSFIVAYFLPVIMEIIVAGLGYKHLGARDDVLCAAFASLMLLSPWIMICMSSSRKKRMLEFSVSLQDSSIEDLHHFAARRVGHKK